VTGIAGYVGLVLGVALLELIFVWAAHCRREITVLPEPRGEISIAITALCLL